MQIADKAAACSSARLKDQSSNETGIKILSESKKLIEEEIKDLRLLSKFDKAFEDGNLENEAALIPTQDQIRDYITNVSVSSQISSQTIVVSAVCIERLLQDPRKSITPRNWQAITFCAISLATKLWEDQATVCGPA